MIEDIKKTLWATADKLRANMDAAEYKHVVLDLIFLKFRTPDFPEFAMIPIPQAGHNCHGSIERW
jgi:hypothetical protein